MIPITQIDQCSLKCLATLIGIEVEEAARNPEFMKRFEAWKARKSGMDQKKQPSEWRMTLQYAGRETYVRVYRLRDVNQADHNGNREYLRQIFETYREAQKVVDEMNSYRNEEGQK